MLEVGQVMAGPFCALQLCDMGASVIKVEPPGGDPSRLMGARAGTDSTGFAALNRGKRSIVLDLKVPEGRAALVRLAARADILIENFRPGVMRDLALDYASLSAMNPRLVYVLPRPLQPGHAPSEFALNSAGFTPFALANAFRIGSRMPV